ncbi:MAG: SMI1/KNR4 family protein [Actinobacteria bacterium]|jgi:cell wall assembly regulator SMI1|nr:SMI1/KNR4 family protein [Actinomycetota bacterium]
MVLSPDEAYGGPMDPVVEPFADVLNLLTRVPRAPGAPAIAGASDQEVRDLERRLGKPLPGELAAWLRACNGVVAGPVVLYGARPLDADLDINEVRCCWSAWQERGWIPVAGDGTGNSYVIRAATDEDVSPVFFIDCSEDPDRLAYVVASSLSRFLRFVLMEELNREGWPFSVGYVTSIDPAIADTPGAPLPWTV